MLKRALQRKLEGVTICTSKTNTEITKMNFIKTIAKLLGYKQQTEFQKYMKQARQMMKIAREDKVMGYLCAAQAAVQSAKSYRAAAHASVYYAAV